MAGELGPDWDAKTNFLPGMPEDRAAIPELLYQVIAGRVHTLLRWSDGSVSRGEVPLQDLQAIAPAPVEREGWYDAAGGWIGAELPGSL